MPAASVVLATVVSSIRLPRISPRCLKSQKRWGRARYADAKAPERQARRSDAKAPERQARHSDAKAPGRQERHADAKTPGRQERHADAKTPGKQTRPPDANTYVYLSVTLYDKPLSGKRVSVDIKYLQLYRSRILINIVIA